jgi:Polyketide cyclase / dehydrase and lipid transport
MQSTLVVQHVSVSINRSPEDVYRFASNVENLSEWASGLVGRGSLRRIDSEWVISGGTIGDVKVRFTEHNELGVLDHDVVLESGTTIHNPIRVIPNGSGSEVIFSMFRQPEVSAEEFAKDAQAVERDLRTLKGLLER